MKTISLQLLLAGITDVTVDLNVLVTGITLDSRTVELGYLFCAYRGSIHDGRKFIDQAIERGASAILVESDSEAESYQGSASDRKIFSIPQLRQKVGLIASRFYDNPSSKMNVIGITGTNGKSSICYLLGQALHQLQQKVAVMGTLGNGLMSDQWDKTLEQTMTTTLDPISIQKSMAHYIENGVQYVVMEVSSHALDQGRVNGIDFDYAVFTNLTRDHLDYHQTVEHYSHAKKKLFDFSSLKAAVINSDDEFGKKLIEEYKARLPVYIYCLRSPHPHDSEERADEGYIRTQLIGAFNQLNLKAVSIVLSLLGFSAKNLSEIIPILKPIRGRMQKLGGEKGLPLVILDYSHTPDALEKALQTLRKNCQGKLICVFGCGGNRDKGKRPQMGSIAEQYADKVIVTDDNPRAEVSGDIIKEILIGVTSPEKMTVEVDRKKAIWLAISQATFHDTVLIAGKGHETYQEIQGKRYPFDEQEIVNGYLEEILRSR